MGQQAVDYDKLAAQHGGTVVDPTAIDYDALASEQGGTVGATFSTENEKDAAGNAVVNPNTVGTFVEHAWQQINPLTAAKALVTAVQHPVETAKQIGGAQGALFDKAKAAYQRGDYLEAGRHFASYLLPLVGPAIDTAADEMQAGQYAAGLGDSIGLALAQVGPQMLAKGGKVRLPAAVTNANEAEQAAVAFGKERGIPVDAGTATGNRFVRSAQGLADHSPIGSVVAERAKAQTGTALSRVGGELAEQVHPEAVTPELAGKAYTEGVKSLIRTLSGQADEAYGRLRKLERDPANTAPVPQQRPAAEQSAITARTESSLGHVPSSAELEELRHIYEELDNLPYVKRTWTDLSGERGLKGNAAGGHMQVTAGAGGAPVYREILDVAPGTAELTRGEVKRSIESALETGHYTNAAKGALMVARQRLASGKVSGAPYSGAPTQQMVMPVDLRPFKAAMKQPYDELLRASEITPPMGDKGRALVALDKVMRGPDFAPVSVADSALSDLKAMARGAAMPELRTVGQGVASHAVKNLETEVMAAVKRAGPDAVNALQEGRSATMAKHAVAEVLDSIHAEPVKAYKQAIAPKDTAIEYLRKVQEVQPQAVPMIGRAVLEEMLGTATAEGGFGHAAKLQADWQRLGPQTKQILFGETVPDLDRFFLLAKKLSESPNPSQSGLVVNAGAQFALVFTHPATGIPTVLGSGALSKILHSKAGVRALTQGLSLAVGPARSSIPARAAMGAALLKAAMTARVAPATVPAVAGSTTAPQTP